MEAPLALNPLPSLGGGPATKSMEAHGSDSSLLCELQSLLVAKGNIERRISSIEAQLSENQMKRHTISGENSISSNGLSFQAIHRYSRQLLLPCFGVQGQISLLKSSVLVIGAGGLGSPALLYLTSCGVGHIGIIDHDIVELNNMHRQIIHTEEFIGQPKVESATSACKSINCSIKITMHHDALNTANAIEIVSRYDIVIDASDNAPTRYMINDCCVILGKPLISGAALGVEGQLTVYNYNGGPCYRCLFPIPPPAMDCQKCSDSGVLGVVPGVIGCLQALEAIKIASGVGQPLSSSMLIFDALSTSFKTVRIRGRSTCCEVCGENSNFSNKFRDFDYELFTQSSLTTQPVSLNLVSASRRLSCLEYRKILQVGEAHVLVDVRPKHHFDIVSLPNSVSIPLSDLESRSHEISSLLERETNCCNLYVVCRRGNDSQKALLLLDRLGFSSAKDIAGGLESWARDVDPDFPLY